MKTVLVTGANGQLGNSIRLLAENHPGYNFLFTDVDTLDITNPAAVRGMIKDNQVDFVLNCAAYTAVEKAEEDEALCRRINAFAVGVLGKAAHEAGAKMIHVSTDYVFSGTSYRPYVETDVTCPVSAYGRTKLAGEEILQEVCPDAVIIRTAWLYSPFGNNFVKTMQRLTSERETLNVVFDQVGTPTYAGDLAALIYKIIENNFLNRQGIYHYSNEGVCSWYDFAKEICALSGNCCDIQPCHSDEFPSKVKRPHFSVLDKTKVKKTFGITVPYWKDSLVKCIEELKQK